LMAILNDVLDHSKIEAGKLNLSRAPLSLHATASSVVALFRANAQAKGLTLVLDLAPGVVNHVIGDSQRIKQVLLNLVGNAIKFTERGGVTLQLAALSGQTAHSARVRFKVIDTGIGVPPEAMGRLFQPFQQVETARGKRLGGTGLGLAISQKIVEAMGGRIEVNSRSGVGSTFHFDLPLEIDPHPPSGDSTDSSMSAFDVLPHRLSGTVLVVEDNAVNRIIAEEMLESLGLHIVEAEDGLEALDVLARRSVDLVLMDCQMPVMDGYTATQHIRARETRQRLPRTPIVALTANAYEEDAAHAQLLGRHTCLPIVAVKRRRDPPLPLRHIRPRLRIQNEILIRVDAVAIQVLQEQRLSLHAIHTRALVDQRIQRGRGCRYANQRTAGVAHQTAQSPPLHYVADDLVRGELRSLIVEAEHENERLG